MLMVEPRGRVRHSRAMRFLDLLVLSACASSLNEAGQRVSVVTAITPSDLEHYEEVGRGECAELFFVMDPHESCRTQLRNGAATLGADIVLVERLEAIKCVGESSPDKDAEKKSCV